MVLFRAQQYIKTQADKRRSPRTFQVGDAVFLKLQPYIQSSVATRACHKLSFRFFGPFKIISKINDVAFKLELPPQAQVHPVFHVSQLRRFVQPGTPISPELPTNTDIPAVPMEILQTRWRKKQDGMIEQVRVRWSDAASMGDTWEDKIELQARFPDAEAWGQASSQGGGDVSSPDMPGPLPSPRGGNGARPRRARKANARYQGAEWVHATGPETSAT